MASTREAVIWANAGRLDVGIDAAGEVARLIDVDGRQHGGDSSS
jgi:hypothetical protein